MTPLRPYQHAAIEATLAKQSAGVRRILIVSPTGSGKTVLIADLIRRYVEQGDQVLFLAGARELVNQTGRKLDDVGVSHGIIMAGRPPALARPVQVASIQTLVNRALPPAKLVCVDEADLARAQSYETVLAAYPDAHVIGLTATPWRADGRGLGTLFDDLVVAATPAELIAQGHLVRPTGQVFEPLDVSGIKTTAGEYNQRQLGERATSAAGAKLAGDIVERWHEFAAGKRTVVFCAGVEHSRMLRERFTSERVHGAPLCQAEHLDGTMDEDVREGLFARVRSGETHVVTNCGVLTRGVDIPALEVAVLARCTKSLPLYLQMVGRVLRPSPGTGKERAIILDHAGCIMRNGVEVHGLPDAEREYSLDFTPPKEKQEKAPSIKQCLKCYAVCASRELACPNCGKPFVVKSLEQANLVEHAASEAISLDEIRLRKLGPGAARVHQAWLDRYVQIEAEKHWESGELDRRFHEHFGCSLSFPQLELARDRFAGSLRARAGGM